eukprot:3332313-Rhodomonas_salina.3
MRLFVPGIRLFVARMRLYVPDFVPGMRLLVRGLCYECSGRCLVGYGPTTSLVLTLVPSAMAVPDTRAPHATMAVQISLAGGRW